MDIKKLLPEKKLSKKALAEFIDRKGYYIIILLCIAIVGVTAVFVTTYNMGSDNGLDSDKIIADEPSASPALKNFDDMANQNLDVAASSISQDTASNNTQPVETASADTPKTQAKADDKSVAANTNPADSQTNTAGTASSTGYIVPVFGETILEFAQDKLVYSKTLEEWRAHSGVDIAADRGTAVKAVTNGVVSDVKNDPRLGITVIIDHQNGIKSVYSNLASDNMVYPNLKVSQGEVIGSVGNTAYFESVEQSHLHFEVWKNNAPVDPSSYVPINAVKN